MERRAWGEKWGGDGEEMRLEGESVEFNARIIHILFISFVYMLPGYILRG